MNNLNDESKTDHEECDHTQPINLVAASTVAFANAAVSTQSLAMRPHMAPKPGLMTLRLCTPSPSGGQFMGPVLGTQVSSTQHFTAKQGQTSNLSSWTVVRMPLSGIVQGNITTSSSSGALSSEILPSAVNSGSRHMIPSSVNTGLPMSSILRSSPNQLSSTGHVIRQQSLSSHVPRGKFDSVSAKQHVKQLEFNNFKQFVILLSTVMASTSSAVARKSAGLRLKYSLTSNKSEEKAYKYHRYLSLSEEVRNCVKNNLVRAMDQADAHSMYVSDCVSIITIIEISSGKSPEIICILTQIVMNETYTDQKKESALDVIGFICQQVDAGFLFSCTTDILKALTHGLLIERNELVKFAARKAFINALHFFQRNLQKTQENFVLNFVNDVAEFSGNEATYNINLLLQTAALISNPPAGDYPDLKDKVERAIEIPGKTTDAPSQQKPPKINCHKPAPAQKEEKETCQRREGGGQERNYVAVTEEWSEEHLSDLNETTVFTQSAATQQSITSLDILARAANFVENATPKSKYGSNTLAAKSSCVKSQVNQSNNLMLQQHIQQKTADQITASIEAHNDKAQNVYRFRCLIYGLLFCEMVEWNAHYLKEPEHTYVCL